MNNISERYVQAIWYDVALRPKNLITSNGEEVRVLSPGEWNGGAGPDFSGAVIELNKSKRMITGDVEVHICPTDWDLHGHGADPNYRNVIAHVTWKEGPIPKSLPKDAISIYLGRCMDSSFMPEQIDIQAYPHLKLPISSRPCERQYAGNQESAQKMLCRIGRQRIKMKARRLMGRLLERMAMVNGDDKKIVKQQLFYEELMSALGYSRNTDSFRHLAERVPISSLPVDKELAAAALIAAAQFENFDYHSQRPVNRPEKRIELAAQLITSPSVMELSLESDFSKQACRMMMERLTASKSLGKCRAAAIIANVILPFAVAEGRAPVPQEYLPPEDVSLPVRTMAMRLLGRDHNPSIYIRNGLALQGLLQVYKYYCGIHYPKCDDCALAG